MTKKPELNKMLKDMQHKMDKLQERMELAKKIPFDLLVQAFPEGHWWDATYDWEFCLPFNFELIPQVMQFCIDQGWIVKNERQYLWDESAKAGHFFDVYLNRPYGVEEFEIAFRSGSEGDTCELKQIGTKEIPIFEIVCKDGAKEEW